MTYCCECVQNVAPTILHYTIPGDLVTLQFGCEKINYISSMVGAILALVGFVFGGIITWIILRN